MKFCSTSYCTAEMKCIACRACGSHCRPTTHQPIVRLTCSACDWKRDWSSRYSYQRARASVTTVLQESWSLGLKHAWDNRGHIVHTHVDGRLRATQQVATMSEELGTVHNTVVVDETADRDDTNIESIRH